MSNPNGPMACPNDGATLVMSERSGIEIDYCPTCRGVWLDRGELDHLISMEGAQAQAQPVAAPPVQQASPQAPQQGYQGGYQQGGYQQAGYQQPYGGKPYKKKKSFLEELFD